MQTGLFETLGKIAGIAGVSVGVVLLVYRQIAGGAKPKNGLPADYAYRTYRLLIISTFLVGTMGIGAWLVPKLVTQPAHTISGNVRDRVSRLGVEDVQVTVSGHSEFGTSLSSGNYTITFTDLPPKGAVLTLWFTKQGYKPQSSQAQIGDSNANMELELLPLSAHPLADHNQIPMADHHPAPPPPGTQGPRVLTPDNAGRIQACLTNHPINSKTVVWFVGKTDDSWAYAREISQTLQGALPNESLNDSGNPLMPLGPVRDVEVRTRYQDDNATQLRNCLKSGGIKAHLTVDPLNAAQNPLAEGYLPKSEIDLVVGPKS